MRNKTMFVWLALALALLALVSPAAAGASALDGYEYHQTIEYAACDQETYQQDIVVHRTTGTAYEETVGTLRIWHIYVGDHCRVDYGDIRFTNSTGAELAYYLWPDYSSESARFTVRLEGADQSGALTVWYGNPTATTTSDGDATFLLYVDFDDEVNPFTQGDAEATFAGGFVSNATTLDPAGKSLRLAGDSAAKARYMPQVFGRGIQVDYYQYVPSTNPTSSIGGLYLAVQTPMDGYQCVLDERIAQFDVQIRKNFRYDLFIGTGDLKNDEVLKSKWHKVRVTWAADGTITLSRCHAITGEVFDTASGVDTTYSSGYLGFCTYDVTYIDHATVRTYSAAPPAALTFSGPPIASFTTHVVWGYAPLTVRFTDTSTGDITGWHWDFGDGTTSNDQNPTHTYTEPGTYTVSLTVSNAYGKVTETKTDLITALGPPGAITPPDLENYDLRNGTYTQYWLDFSNGFPVYGLIYAICLPFINIFGYWFFAMLWFLYLGLSYLRTGDVTLPLTVGLISGAVWGVIMPPETFIVGYVMLATSIVAILMKLFLRDRL